VSKHYPPVFLEEQFHCPHCNVYASQLWSRLIPKSNASRELEVRIAFCNHCDGYTIWKQEVMVFPDGGAAAMPHDDMPANVKEDYLEARAIVNKSPKGAAALLRLALQRLMRHLGRGYRQWFNKRAMPCESSGMNRFTLGKSTCGIHRKSLIRSLIF
jgi:hypothetical protein